MNIKIQPARESDNSAIHSLLSQIVEVHYEIRPDIFRSSYANNSTGFYEDEDTPVFVAVDENGFVIGCLWCIIHRERDNSLKIDRDWLVIDDICVDGKYRKQGIGRKLVDFAVQFAQQKGLSRIELNVYNDNHNAVRFYEHYGFRTQKRVMELDIFSLHMTDKERRGERT